MGNETLPDHFIWGLVLGQNPLKAAVFKPETSTLPNNRCPLRSRFRE